MTGERTASTGLARSRCQSIVDQLRPRFLDVPLDDLVRIVEHEYRRLEATATVLTYLPVLVLRAASEQLRTPPGPA